MIEKNPPPTGKPLVIVESPAKARTISKFLGKGYTVEASVGHVRDLPNGAKEVPEAYKKERWAYLGVNVDKGFEPIYVVPPDKKEQVRKLKTALKDATELYLATDEDREGEAISWHLCELLKPKVPIRRLVFHEITEEAIRGALAHPRSIHDGMVRAQETRRILDRLYGYEVSPLLWRKVKPRLSAGRVQSVAVRMIVEREQARREFIPAEYWDLLGQFATGAHQPFEATLVALGQMRLASGKDFDPKTGTLQGQNVVCLDRAAANALAERLRGQSALVAKVEEKPFVSRPAPPFTTSTLQQEANRKLGFTAKRTMSTAQALYENGHITYMRTDSTNLASVAVEAARELVRSEYGSEYLDPEPRIYRSKVKNAQEAHEAIRPAGHPFSLPSTLRNRLKPDEFRLFELIWKRTIASQMKDARGRRMTITLRIDDALFQVSGSTIDFPGYLRAYVEGSDDPDAELADKETILPAVQEGDALECRGLIPKSHSTQPPARFTEASLTKALEDRGIGRPSTYASIIETIQQRQYVFKRSSALVPSWVAFSVWRLLREHFTNLVDYEFTAQMEDDLDAISRGEAAHVEYLNRFYFGNGSPGLKKLLESKSEEVDARDVSRFYVGRPAGGTEADDVYVRVGKFGPFLEQGSRRASLPEDMPPDELTLARALEFLDKSGQGDEPLGVCPESGRQVFVKVGRFGPYVQLGSSDEAEKPRNASLLKGMDPASITLDVAIRLLSLPRTLGVHPDNHEPVMAFNGRYGPFVKCASETRTLPADLSPIDVTLEQATALLAQPKASGRRAASRETLKAWDPSEQNPKAIKILDGRYGPYLTDGETNASVPKDMAVEDVSLELALQILADRAAQGSTSKKARGTKRSTKKRPATKKATPKAATKKTPKKPAKKAAPKKSRKAAPPSTAQSVEMSR